MARPRRETQDVLVERIASALSSREQFEPWTLADIAPAAGLSPAGLIKRFGSRNGILQTLSRRWIDSVPDGPQGSLTAEEELRAWIASRFAPNGPHAIASGLVNLIDDIIDDQLRSLLAEGWGKEIRYVASLLERLDLTHLHDPITGASLLFDALNGAMLRNATEPDTPASPLILDHLLEIWT